LLERHENIWGGGIMKHCGNVQEIFTLAMDRKEWRDSHSDGLRSVEIDASIRCTAILARNSGSDGKTKCPSPYARGKKSDYSVRN
jgi:hypothetical protein